MDFTTVLCSLVLLGAVIPVQSDTHSLYYMYTALSHPVDLPGIYDFTAMGLLDDRQIDYYNSKDKIKIPKQEWMKEKMQQDYWEKGTQSRKSKEQWFTVNVKILMDRMRHNNTDLHVLQWRHGCEINKEGNEMTFMRGIDEYSYDGENFLSFDDTVSQWVAPVDAAVPTKRKWDNVPILNQYTKGYLEKECVDWLNKFREYGEKELSKVSPPDVKVFARKSHGNKLKLTCLATGFYPKDVKLVIRKYRTSLPNNETESSGVRPNHDGTYQLRKSVEITENEKADYDCYVTHRTLKEPVIIRWDGECSNCNEGAALASGVGIGVLITVLLAVAGFLLYKRVFPTNNTQTVSNPDVLLPPAEPQTAVEILNNNTPPDAENAALLNRSQEKANESGGGSSGNDLGSNETGINDSGKGSSGESSSNSSASSQENVKDFGAQISNTAKPGVLLSAAEPQTAVEILNNNTPPDAENAALLNRSQEKANESGKGSSGESSSNSSASSQENVKDFG